MTLLVRAVFMTFMFPRIFKYGRAWLGRREELRAAAEVQLLLGHDGENETEADDECETEAARSQCSGRSDRPAASVPVHPPLTSAPTSFQGSTPSPIPGKRFDLHFLRLSILLDALLTSCVALAGQGWHLYLAAVVLLFASGTAAAYKGVTLDLAEGYNKSEALAGIALLEKVARVATIGLFGWLFGWLSQVDKANLVFVVNGVSPSLSYFAYRTGR